MKWRRVVRGSTSRAATPVDAAPGPARITRYFTGVRRVVELLANMAELQRSGMPHTAEQVAFINQAVRIESGGSGPPFHDGWYRELFFDPTTAFAFDPTIAGVHTRPGGDTPFSRGPSVLHVGTGWARAMLVSIDTCVGPRAYAGVVHSYYENASPASLASRTKTGRTASRASLRQTWRGWCPHAWAVG